MMRARYVAGTDLETLLQPDSPPWKQTRSEAVSLIGTPVGLQPTNTIRVAWTGKPIGAVTGVEVAAVHDGGVLAFRLAWSDASENREIDDLTAFPDAAAILLPGAPAAPLVTMGAPGTPVNGWYWRADEDGRGRHVIAEGLGTTRTLDLELVRGHGAWKDGRWHVVITRALRVDSPEPIAQLEPGTTASFGVAVWEGGHQERAGLKSFSGDWRELHLEAAPTARR